MGGSRASKLGKAALALAGSIALHAAGAFLLGRAAKHQREHPPQKPVSVQVVEVEKKKPPPPPPPPPEKPKPPPPKVVHVIKPPPDLPKPTPPPPSEKPPPEAKNLPPPVVLPGITLESTTATGGFAVNTGNTLYGDPGTKGHDPSTVKPYRAEKYVAAAKVTEMPSILNRDAVEVRKFYPAEAKKEEFEADVVLKLLIDSDGSIAKITVISDPGHGLAEAAQQLVHAYIFGPAKVDGVPVATTINFPVHFTLNN